MLSDSGFEAPDTPTGYHGDRITKQGSDNSIPD